MASNYKANIDRMSEDDAFDPYRETGKKCQYIYHRGDRDATIMVEVNNECCPDKKTKEENHVVRLCWRCTSYGYQDDFYCGCQTEDGHHSADSLTFKGELASVS
jgi:hypothetical protein